MQTRVGKGRRGEGEEETRGEGVGAGSSRGRAGRAGASRRLPSRPIGTLYKDDEGNPAELKWRGTADPCLVRDRRRGDAHLCTRIGHESQKLATFRPAPPA